MIQSSAKQHTFAGAGISGNLDNYAIDAAYDEHRSSPHIAGVSAGSGVVVAVKTTGSGVLETAFSNLYYNRIWIIPRNIDLGNLVASQTKTIEVWNAYFTSKTLTNITIAGDQSGFTLTGFASGVFNAQQSKLYTASVNIAGSPVVNLTANWNFVGEGTNLLTTFNGQRVIPFTLRHNWVDPVLEQISFRTDVLTGESGKEQRIGSRKLPRRRIEMSYLTLTPQERAYLENLTFGWQGRTFAVPLWSDATTLSAPATAGSSVFNCNTQIRDFDPNGFCFITDGVNHDVLEILSISPTTVTTKTNSIYAFNAGAQIVPTRFGLLEPKIDFGRITNHAESTRQAWQLLADTSSLNRRQAYSPTLYRGVEVYNVSNDYSASIQIEQENKEDYADNEIGAFGKTSLEPFPRRTYPFKNLYTRSQFGLFLEFIYNRQGQLTPFWFCERVPSFFLAVDALSSSTTLTVETVGYSQFINSATPRKDIAIQTGTNTWIYRRILATVNNFNGTETMTLDSAIGTALTVTGKPLIAYLKLVRLNQDAVEIAYETTDVIRTATSFTDLLTN